METTNAPVFKFNPNALMAVMDAIARRALDIIASALGLLVLSPLFLLVAVLIKRDSPGPIFYFGPRVGANGRLFRILKFRTMFERQESYAGPRITAEGDSRITPLGRWLRDTKINELPQLWNVLVGDMALVGPRPEDPEIAKGWPEQLRSSLLSVRPGITSPATVIFRGEEKMLQSANIMDDYLRTILPDKLRIDSLYLRNRNLLTDLDVIFMTLLLLLPKLRKTDVPETALYWGPLAQFSSRYLNWFFVDTILAFLAMAASAMVWRLSAPLHIGTGQLFGVSLMAGLCFSVFNYMLGLTKIQWRRAPAWEVFPLAFSSGFATLVVILIDFGFFHHWEIHTTRPHLPLGMLILTGFLSFACFAAVRYRERLLTGFASFWLNVRRSPRAVGERVLLVGAGRNSELAVWLLTRSEFSRMFSIVGIVDDDPRKQNLYYDGFPVLGTTRNIPALIEKNDVGLVIFTITNIDEAERQRILKDCRASQVHVVILPDVMADLTMRFQAAVEQPQNQNLYPGR